MNTHIIESILIYFDKFSKRENVKFKKNFASDVYYDVYIDLATIAITNYMLLNDEGFDIENIKKTIKNLINSILDKIKEFNKQQNKFFLKDNSYIPTYMLLLPQK